MRRGHVKHDGGECLCVCPSKRSPVVSGAALGPIKIDVRAVAAAHGCRSNPRNVSCEESKRATKDAKVKRVSCVWPVSGVVGGGQLQESVHSLARTLHGTAACLVACLRVAIAGQMPRKKKRFVYSVTSYAHLSFQGSPQRLRPATPRLAPVTTVLKPPKGQG